MLFTKPTVLIALLNSYFLISVAESLDSVLPRKLKMDFDFNESRVGMYFLAELLPACVVGLLYTLLSNRKDGRAWLLLGGYLSSFSQLIIGPSALFHLPNSKEVVLAGLICNGVGFGFLNAFFYQEPFRAAS